MCEFKCAHFVVIVGTLLQVVLSQPPCTEKFKYLIHNGQLFGRMEFENDFSGTFEITLKVSTVVHSNEHLYIEWGTSTEDLRNGKNIVYIVGFPRNQRTRDTIPTPIKIVFNNELYCHDPTPYNSINEETISNFFRTSRISRPIGFIDHDHEGASSWPQPQPLAVISEGGYPTNRRPQSTNLQPQIVSEIPSRSKPQSTSGKTECGLISSGTPLIIGGEATRKGEYPWLVALFYKEGNSFNYKCAGTLISNRHVVTAAHCVAGNITVIKRTLFAVFGKHDIQNWVANSVVRNAEKIVKHHEYKKPSDADIAVITINDPVPFGDLIKPACPWDEDTNFTEGETGVVAGWGWDESGNLVEEARQIEIPAVNPGTCVLSNINFHPLVSNRTFCAGEIGKIPCKGDSGSGFMMKREGRWKLRGVVSASLFDSKRKSCDVGNYAVFADVPKYGTWLNKILQED